VNAVYRKSIKIPDAWSKMLKDDWEKMALEIPPYENMESRIRRAIAPVAEAYFNGVQSKTQGLKFYTGPKKEVVGEGRDKRNQHLIYAMGEEWLCPCNKGGECLLPNNERGL